MEKTKNEKKHGNSNDPQISRPDLRFASRENSETTQNGAGATPNKKPHKSMGIAPDTIGSSPPCLRNMHKRINSLWPKQINRGKKQSNCKNQQHGCEKLMYTTGATSESSQACFVCPRISWSASKALIIATKHGCTVREWRVECSDKSWYPTLGVPYEPLAQMTKLRET